MRYKFTIRKKRRCKRKQQRGKGFWGNAARIYRTWQKGYEWMYKKKFKLRRRKRKLRPKQKGRGFWGNTARGINNLFSAWHKAYQWDEKEIMRWWN